MNRRNKMRLHELTQAQFEQWRQARFDAGQSRYGDAHLQRYGLVDVMEELMDADNILTLFMYRVRESMATDTQRDEIAARIYTIKVVLGFLASLVRELDSVVPDDLCTDERGGERIWWSEQAGEKRAG